MPNLHKINGLVLCDETNVNGVTLANINQIGGLDKSCGVCNTIQLGAHTFNCARACLVTCTTHYIDKDISVSPVAPGDHIYPTSDCLCNHGLGVIYFSTKCGGRSGLCYTINHTTCAVISAASC